MAKIERNFTNKKNLPEILADAVMNDKYDSGKSDISVTTLLDSPRVRILSKKHQKDIVTDVSDLFASAMGTAFHHFMELSDETSRHKIKILQAISVLKEKLGQIKDGNDWSQRDKVVNLINNLDQFYSDEYPEFSEDVILEVRLFIEVGKHILSGQFDRLKVTMRNDEGNITHAKLSDYKQVSTFAYKNPMDIEKWTKQQNIYRWMLFELYGIRVEELNIVMVFRDWSKSQAKIKGAAYPQTWGDQIKLDLIPYDEIREFVHKRVKKHMDAEKLSMEDFDTQVKCSKKDVWLRDESFAVKKKDGIRALTGGIFERPEDAEKFLQQNQSLHKEELIIEHRPGKPVRCLEYCQVKEHCSQFKAVEGLYINQ
jgi:hypothetical protein